MRRGRPVLIGVVVVLVACLGGLVPDDRSDAVGAAATPTPPASTTPTGTAPPSTPSTDTPQAGWTPDGASPADPARDTAGAGPLPAGAAASPADPTPGAPTASGTGPDGGGPEPGPVGPPGATGEARTTHAGGDPTAAPALPGQDGGMVPGVVVGGGQEAAPYRVTASSSAAGVRTFALVDGAVSRGYTGDEWAAAPGDAAPWVQLDWSGPRRVSSVQAFGPARPAVDPAAWALAALHGRVVFDDGTAVVVSGIAAGGGQATTIAFPARTTRSLRVELDKSFPGAVVALRELAVHDAGTTPPRWPVGPGGHAATAVPAGPCSLASTPVGRPSGGAAGLVCPAPGSAVSGTATVVVSGPPATAVTAKAWVDPPGSAPGAVAQVASATTDATGRAALRVDTTRLTDGPTALRVTLAGSTAALYVQLVNRSGVAADTRDHAPAGLTLQWAEEFTEPLSTNRRGDGVVYAATKPSWTGGVSFGDSWFADPDEGAGTLATLDREHLRLRVQPADPATTPWGLAHTSGILSSLHAGGAGFAAQYGYFEARILGAPGTGSWPAFWMMDTESTTSRATTEGEVDAVELYGHNTEVTCHTVHNWGHGAGSGSCPRSTATADWALTWHTYAVQIVPDGAVYYVDGVEVHRTTGFVQSADPYYFLVDLALGGGWPVDLAPTGEVTEMYVDWVRVWT